jgi:hypothetical protein
VQDHEEAAATEEADEGPSRVVVDHEDDYAEIPRRTCPTRGEGALLTGRAGENPGSLGKDELGEVEGEGSIAVVDGELTL